MAAWRRITVDEIRYCWLLSPQDGGLRLTVRALDAQGGGRAMITWFPHGNLVTPWLVREAIIRARREGWDYAVPGPARAFHYQGVIPDRTVEFSPPEPPTESEVELLDSIADAPDDETRFLVYADWLQERGVAQGEVITLACTGERSPEQTARMTELESSRETQWLGPVAAVTDRRVWWRGLLRSCTLAKRDPGVVEPALGHRAWRTVQELDGRGGFLAPEDIARLVQQPALAALRRLSIDHEVALVLPNGCGFARLEELALVVTRVDATVAVAGALARLHLPKLRRLEVMIRASDLKALLAVPIVPRLEALVVECTNVDDLPLWLYELDRNDARFGELVICPWGFQPRNLRPPLRVRRGSDGRWSELHIAFADLQWPQLRASVLALLEALPPDTLSAFSATCTPADPAFVSALHLAASRQRRLTRS